MGFVPLRIGTIILIAPSIRRVSTEEDRRSVSREGDVLMERIEVERNDRKGCCVHMYWVFRGSVGYSELRVHCYKIEG